MSRLNHFKVRLLITSILICGWVTSIASIPVNTDNRPEAGITKCDEIEVKLEITHTSANLHNGEILLEFKKPSTSYTSFIFSGADGDNRLDVKDNKVTDLGKGEYNLYVQNQEGCTKHIKFKIN